MTSAYRPTQANAMTGSSVAHGFAGGVHLKDSMAGMDEKFDKPTGAASRGKGIAPGSSTGTHTYGGSGMQGTNVTHPTRF